MSRWPNMDRKAWGSSTVMKEYENLILEVYKNLEIKKAQLELKKKAGIISDTQKATENIQKANQSAKELVSTLSQNLADDSEDLEDSDITEEQYSDAKDSLINELKELSYAAADEKNIKLAYKIERTVFDLEKIFKEE